MQNAVTRRELLPAILIEEIMTRAGSKVAGILDAIPGMIRRRDARIPATILDLIVGEVARARNIAAAVTLKNLCEDTPVGDLIDEETEDAHE